MQWKEIFPSHVQPSMDEIAEYIGGEAKALWLTLMEYMEAEYKVKPKLSYSVCAGKPGWNIKLQKSGQLKDYKELVSVKLPQKINK